MKHPSITASRERIAARRRGARRWSASRVRRWRPRPRRRSGTTTTTAAPTTTTVAVAGRAAHRPARPGGAQPHPARAVGEGREHRTTARPAGRHRPGRRRLRRGRRRQHHALRRHLQLRRARRDRPGALGARRGPRHRVADRRRSSPTRAARRSTSTPSTRRRCTRSTRTPPASAMVRNEPSQPPRDAPHNLYGLGPAAVRARRRPRCRRRRCSSTSPTGAPAVTGTRRARASTSASTAGLRPDVDVGRAPPARGSASIDGRAVDGRRAGVADRADQRGGAVHARTAGEAEAQTVGEGDVVGVHRRHGAHGPLGRAPTRPSRPSYVDATGQPILLRPGRTWVELLPTGPHRRRRPTPRRPPPRCRR